MLVIPAMDIKGRKAVTGSERGLGAVLVSNYPVHVARSFQDDGAELLNIIDLDAFGGNGDNLDTIKDIRYNTQTLLQVGGGIRTAERAYRVAEYADKIFLGARISSDTLLLKELSLALGKENLSLFVDIKDKKGFTRKQSFEPVGFVEKRREYFGSVYFRDVDWEFLMAGVDSDFYQEMCREFGPFPVLACGGVGSLDDLKALQDTGVYGVVVGKAFYTGRIKSKDAIKAFS